jgi:chromate transport protein ChrA
MHEELVVRRRWLSEKRFLHALNYCMVLPGPEAQQLATYIGWSMHKTRGGVAAGVLFVLPSLFMLIGLSWLYIAFGHVTWVAGLFYGIKPAVTAIVVQAAHRIGSRALKQFFIRHCSSKLCGHLCTECALPDHRVSSSSAGLCRRSLVARTLQNGRRACWHAGITRSCAD